MNCILLPASHILSSKAHIDSPKQLEHINSVLQCKVGDRLKIGQSGGALGSAIIDSISPQRIELREVQLSDAPPAKLNVTVILALPRPKVLRRLIMDMTALGVPNIVLINSYRTQKSYWQSPMLNRLDEFVQEGLQQGVDTIAPRISLKKRFKPFVEDELAGLNQQASPRIMVAHPYSELSLAQYLQSTPLQAANMTASPVNLPHNNRITIQNIVFIGAEGGWIEYEIDLLAAHGCQPVHIGPRILRTEAAVNVILGQLIMSSGY